MQACISAGCEQPHFIDLILRKSVPFIALRDTAIDFLHSEETWRSCRFSLTFEL